jgi:hypothetical protein
VLWGRFGTQQFVPNIDTLIPAAMAATLRALLRAQQSSWFDERIALCTHSANVVLLTDRIEPNNLSYNIRASELNLN